jgi:hypothetical protein
MKHNCFFDISICVFTSCIIIHKLAVEIVEVKLNLCTTCELPFSIILLVLISLRVKLASNCVLVDSDEICDHVPKQMHLLG